MKNSTQKRPNLLFIFSDNLRYSALGYNGDIKAKTPNIDALAQCSLVLENCVSNHPLSSSYAASLFTGKYSTSTGVIAEDIKISPYHHSFIDCLNENGYQSEFVGKWNLSSSNDKFIPEDSRLGFNGFFATFPEGTNPDSSFYNFEEEEKVKFNGFIPDIEADLAIQRIDKLFQGDKPFALFVSLSTPGNLKKEKSIPEKVYEAFESVRFALPKNYDDINDYHTDSSSKMSKSERKNINEWKRAYYSAVSNIDTNIGKIMEKIVELKLDDDTVIVFTSNHGEMFSAHGRKGKNIFYDEAVRVPFIIRYGEKLEIGKNESCFGTVDIMPTLLNLMGISNCPDDVQGQDKSQYLLSSSSDYSGQLLMGTGPTNRFGSSMEWRAYRTKQFTYAVFKSDNEEILFDNINDPLQLTNLIYDKKFLEIGKRIKDEMYAEMAGINDTFEENGYYKKYWIKNKKVCVKLK